MIKEDILKAITELPKEENKQVLSSMNAINVDELMNAIDRFNKVPSYNDLLKENRELCKKLENSFSYEEYDYQVNRNIELRKEKQELIEYLKEQINECKLTGNDEDYIKKDVYEEILYKIEKR